MEFCNRVSKSKCPTKRPKLPKFCLDYLFLSKHWVDRSGVLFYIIDTDMKYCKNN